MAIAAGICDGMGFGYNARAALITRGLAEITRLGLKLGDEWRLSWGWRGPETSFSPAPAIFPQPAGGTDAGAGAAAGRDPQDLGHVAEGVYTAREVLHLGNRLDVELPITQAVCRVLFEGLAPKAAVEELLNREPRAETY